MPRILRRRAAAGSATENYAAFGDPVPVPARFFARRVALALGLARTIVGATFLAAPVAALRLLGVDTATAARTTWLSRMAAARDAVLGAGTLASSANRKGAPGWLLAGAVADAADAVALTAALRTRKVAGFGALAMIFAAAGAAAAGMWAAVESARRR